MQPDLNRVVEQVSKEKGIEREIIVKALEEAMLSAAKKTFGHEKNIEAKFNTDLGEVELFDESKGNEGASRGGLGDRHAVRGDRLERTAKLPPLPDRGPRADPH